MTYAADRKPVTLEEFAQTQGLSLQEEEFPDLTDTGDVSVVFSHTFRDGYRVDFRVADGIVSSGDQVLGSYKQLLDSVREYEEVLTEPDEGLSGQAAITSTYCKVRVLFCFDYDGRKWNNGIIKYEPPTTAEFTSGQIAIINNAIQDIEASTDVDFQVSYSGDRVWFTNRSGGCWSWLGRAGGRQRVNLESSPIGGGTCVAETVIKHELGHVMGLIHEHQRFDRDHYVTVHYNNIPSGDRDQFSIFGHDLALVSTYDLDSIMHYHSYAFAVGGPSITRKDGTLISRNYPFSTTDISLINTYY